MANSIIAGNDFRLIIRAKKSTGAYLADMDLADVEDLRIYLTRAGRSKVLQSYTLDEEGHAVIYVNAGAVTNATYGIEMVGVYGGARLRAHNTSVFTISGHGGGNSGVLNDYYADIVFVINVAATDVYVQNAIEAHNEDEASHPHLLQLIEEAGDVDDVQIDGESIVDENKIAKIDSSQFGKVDDVKVNGMSVVSNKEANITIPEKVSDLPNDADYATQSELTTGLAAKQDTITAVADPTIADDGGNPSASVNFEDGEMAFAFKNLKLRFSDLTAADKAELKGEKGDQGDSAVYDPSSPDAPDFVMANTTGQSTTKAMAQKAVTDELNVRPTIDDTTPDLAFADEDGNEIVQFEDGHIKTQQFDSREVNIKGDEENRGDFTIVDENGNMVVRFADGHINTKNFNSETLLDELEDIKASGNEYGIMFNLAAKMYVRENPFGIEANTLYKDGALRMGGDVAPLFIVGGQSNADGRAALADAPDWLESDYTLPNYMMWTGSTFADYNIRTNNGHWPTFDTGKDKFAMDLFFAHSWLVDNPGKKIYCIKNTMGDVGIQDQPVNPTYAGHNYTWQPKLDTIVEGCNSLFVVLINKMIAVHRWAVANQIKLVPIAVLWHQGEHDGGADKVYYDQNIKNVISFFRGLCSAPALPFLAGHLLNNTEGSGGHYINQVYDTLPPLDAYTKVVNMDGHRTSIGDNLHFDAAAHEYMGEQMYAYWKSLNV